MLQARKNKQLNKNNAGMLAYLEQVEKGDKKSIRI